MKRGEIMPVNTIEANELIAKYKETGDITLRNQIILLYGNLVKYIAISTRNLYLKYAETNDIVNEGIISLISALESFDLSKNVKFETYASIRIKGAIIDFIRKQDFIPRNVRKFSKDLDLAYASLHFELSREPTTSELAEHFGTTEEKLRKQMGEAAGAATLSFEELLYENNFDISENNESGTWEAEKSIVKNEMTMILSKAIDSLKEKERNVISLYYYEKLKFSEIAKVLQVTESRVCQIHSKSMMKLKYFINDYLNQ